MSELMEKAISRARTLPESDQDAIAAIILREIESEARWEELLSDPRSTDLLSRWADEAMEDVKQGRAIPLDLDDL